MLSGDCRSAALFASARLIHSCPRTCVPFRVICVAISDPKSCCQIRLFLVIFFLLVIHLSCVGAFHSLAGTFSWFYLEDLPLCGFENLSRGVSWRTAQWELQLASLINWIRRTKEIAGFVICASTYAAREEFALLAGTYKRLTCHWKYVSRRACRGSLKNQSANSCLITRWIFPSSGTWIASVPASLHNFLL